jgi:anaerobic magnesium-protoporphyrin IX monomethyl ester cyclase
MFLDQIQAECSEIESPKALKKKILLAIPPTGIFLREDRCQTEAWTMPRPPMTLAYAAAFLEQDGHDCSILDCPAEELSWDQFEQNLRAQAPDALFINVTMPTLAEDVKAFKTAKEINPKILTIAKGADLYINDVKILEFYKELDIGIQGEIDFSIQDIFKNLDNLTNVPGITYRDSSDEVHKNPKKEYDFDLDSFPFPARHLLKNDFYLRPDTNKKLAILYTSRGCPALCTFCAVPLVSGNKLRRRSVESVIDEIILCQKTLEINDFFFFADTFNLDKKWVIKLCNEMIERNLNIQWACNSRPDSIDLEMAQWMKKSGCGVVSFGIETGSDDMLKQIKKGNNVSHCEEAIKVCREAGLKSLAFFMIGLPGETRQDALNTIKFSKKLDPDYIEYNIAQTFPGTDLAIELEKKGVFNHKDNQVSGYSVVSLSENLTLEEINGLLKKAIFEFHFRPSYILKTLKSISSVPEFFNYLKHAIWRFSTFFFKKAS